MIVLPALAIDHCAVKSKKLLVDVSTLALTTGTVVGPGTWMRAGTVVDPKSTPST